MKCSSLLHGLKQVHMRPAVREFLEKLTMAISDDITALTAVTAALQTDVAAIVAGANGNASNLTPDQATALAAAVTTLQSVDASIKAVAPAPAPSAANSVTAPFATVVPEVPVTPAAPVSPLEPVLPTPVSPVANDGGMVTGTGAATA